MEITFKPTHPILKTFTTNHTFVKHVIMQTTRNQNIIKLAASQNEMQVKGTQDLVDKPAILNIFFNSLN